MTNPKFKPGDEVQLKSGGPTMTVVGPGADGRNYHCRWFGPNKDLTDGYFTEPELQLVATPPGSLRIEIG